MGQRYAHSERAAQEFPKYPPTRLVAVSLARRLQVTPRPHTPWPPPPLKACCAGSGCPAARRPLQPGQGYAVLCRPGHGGHVGQCGATVGEAGGACRERGGGGATPRGASRGRGGQDPLREMAGLCVGKSDDVLSLTLHPLQDTLDRAERLRFLHRAFVTVVNEAPPRRSPATPPVSLAPR